MVHYLLVVMLHFEVFHLVSGQIPARLKPSDHLLVLFFCKLGLAFQRTHEGGTMNRMLRPSRPVFTFVFVLTMLLGFAGSSIAHPPPAAHAATSGCQLNSAKGNIQHVIYVQFEIGRASCRERV